MNKKLHDIEEIVREQIKDANPCCYAHILEVLKDIRKLDWTRCNHQCIKCFTCNCEDWVRMDHNKGTTYE